MNRHSVRDLQREAIKSLRRYEAADAGERTRILRHVAEILVDLRALFYTRDGEVDWTGKGRDYRESIANLYGEAGIAPDEARTVRAAVAYHVSNVLRERLTSEDLEHLGLRPLPARDRAREQREHTRSTLSALTGAGGPLTDAAHAIQAARGALSLVSRIDPETLLTITPEERLALSTILHRVSTQSTRLVKVFRVTK